MSGEVISREDLAREVWGYEDTHGIDRSLGVHLHRLREKLQANAAPAPAILAVRGFGYRLDPEPEHRPSSVA